MRPRQGNFTFLNWLYAVSVEAGGEIPSLYEQREITEQLSPDHQFIVRSNPSPGWALAACL